THFVVWWQADVRDLHSFPTRRSSDLSRVARSGMPSATNAARWRSRISAAALVIATLPPALRADRRCPGPRAPTGHRRHPRRPRRSEEHTSELQSRENLVCRLLLEKKK